jgi:tRNA(fMet)-specific endonuclease VapC
MNPTLLLDTNAVIARIANNKAIIYLLATSDEIFLNSIVLGELYYGAEKSSRVEQNIAAIQNFWKGERYLLVMQAHLRFMGALTSRSDKKGSPFLKTICGLRQVQCSMDLHSSRKMHISALWMVSLRSIGKINPPQSPPLRRV